MSLITALYMCARPCNAVYVSVLKCTANHMDWPLKGGWNSVLWSEVLRESKVNLSMPLVGFQRGIWLGDQESKADKALLRSVTMV